MSNKISTHLNEQGNVMMVDISQKVETHREAIATGELWLGSDLAEKLKNSSLTKKGDVFSVATVAGIMAAKKTSEIIPLCHQIPLSKVEINYQLGSETINVTSVVKTLATTGVEMEALMAANIFLITVYDMLKSQNKGMILKEIKLISKTGGKSGDFHA